ncbi:hypothetical protein BJ165DRAFT_1487470, partial [Panaeolus papilionaceus]
MFSFKSIVAAILVISTVSATPAHLETHLDSRDLPPRDVIAGGYQYSSGDGGTITFSGGSYSITWSGSGSFIGGLGWNPGGSRTIRYSGNYNPNGNS